MILHQYDETPCPGMNCGSTDGKHSKECIAEHTAAAAGGDFVKALPIHTAPMDGTEVFAFNGEWNRMLYFDLCPEPLWIYAEEVLADIVPGPDQPTHWTPLIAPPVPNK